MATQEELIVRIGADFDELKTQLTKAGKQTEKFGKKVDSTSDKINASMISMAKRVAGVTAGFFALNKAVGTFTTTLNNARDIAKFSDQLDLSRERFGAYARIAREAGYETEDVFDAMKDLSIKITDAASGAKGYEEVLNKIGLRSRDLLKLNVEDRFLAFARAASTATDATRQFALDELGSDPLLRFNKLIKESGGGLRNMADELLRTGKVASELEYKNLEEAAKAQQQLTEEFDRFTQNMVAKYAPGITKALKAMNGAFEDNADKIKNSEENAHKLKDELDALRKVSFFDLTDQQEKRMRQLENILGLVTGAKGLESPIKEIVDVGQIEGGTVVGDSPKELSLLEQYLEQQKELRDNARMIEMDAQTSFNNQVYTAEQAHAERINKLWDQGLKGRMGVAQEFFGNMSALMESENRKMFEIGKAAAIANTVITTIESAQKAFNSMAGIPVVGPALGAAAAGAAIAAGFARVQAIQSTSMSGGGGFGGGAVAGGGEGGAEQAGPQNVVDATFNIQGTNVGADQIRQLGGQLNELVEDGFVLRSVAVN